MKTLRFAKRNVSEIIRSLSWYTDISLLKPAGITFDITDRCRLKCPTCTKWKTPPEAQYEELSTEEWKSIILKLKQWLGEFSFIFAGGEPLLRRDIFEIISFAVDNDVHPSVISNGCGFNSLAERVVESGLEYIIVSLNGITPYTHDVTRGVEGAYENTMKFIRDVNLKRKKLASKLRLMILTILMPFNCDEAVSLVRWVRDEGIDAIHFQPLDPPGSFHPYPIIGMDSFKPEGADNDWYRKNITSAVGNEKLNKAITELIIHKQQGYPISNSSKSLRRIKTYFQNPKELHSCKIGVSRFNVDPYGNVRFCFDMEPIGNILFAAPKKLYNSGGAIKQRRLIRRCEKPCHWLIG